MAQYEKYCTHCLKNVAALFAGRFWICSECAMPVFVPKQPKTRKTNGKAK